MTNPTVREHVAISSTDPMTDRVAQLRALFPDVFADGKLDDAIRALEKARRLKTDCAGTHAHLAMAYHRQGRKADARAALELARSLPRTPQEAVDTAEAAAILQWEMS